VEDESPERAGDPVTPGQPDAQVGKRGLYLLAAMGRQTRFGVFLRDTCFGKGFDETLPFAIF